MRKYYLLIVVLCVTKLGFGQKNFEGVIDYTVYIEDLDGAPWIHTKAFFKDHAIMVQSFTGEKESPQTRTIYNFDSGFSYEIDEDAQTIIKDSIIKPNNKIISPLFLDSDKKQRLGHPCILTNYPNVKIGETLDDSTDILLWFANDLPFQLPERYASQAPYIMLANGKSICLVANFAAYLTRNGKAQLTLKAEKIKAMSLPDSLFTLPASYHVIKRSDEPQIIKAQLTEIKADSMPPPPPPPAGKVTIKKLPVQKTTHPKTPPVVRKP